LLREAEIKPAGGKTTGEAYREPGISAYYHDSAAAILRIGEGVAAAREERFTRKKHDSRFPSHGIEYCLSESGIKLSDFSKSTFYDKPLIKFEHLLETYLSYAPKGFRFLLAAMPIWLKEILINNRNH
jgi:carbamoyltransferase